MRPSWKIGMDREWSGVPPGGLGGIWKPSWMPGRGQEALPDIQEGL